MTTNYVVKKLQVQLRAYQEEIVHYNRMLTSGNSDDAKIIYDAEKRYWQGQYDATRSAIAIIQDAEVTGGTPF
jgi:hypothetical protein